MKILFTSKDAGNAAAGVRVAQDFRANGAAVLYLLDSDGWAARTYAADEAFRALFGSMDVRETRDWDPRVSAFRDFDAVFVTLSASGLPNMEISGVAAACVAGRPVYGLEEVVGGRHNPGWEEEHPNAVRRLARLFAAFPMDEDSQWPNVRVVGPPQLDRYRGKDWDAMGAEARRKLEIPAEAPVVFWTGHPEPENPHAVSRLGEALCALKEKLQAVGAVLVVARHGRELNTPVPDNGPAHRHTLRLIRDRVGIRVIENSLGYEKLSADHPDAVPDEFRPREFASYQEIVCACRTNGVVVTGFGTDGQIAGYLGVPSILYLDHHGFLLGGLLWREKKLRGIALPHIPWVRDVEDLHVKLEDVLLDRETRSKHIAALRAVYPFPERSPAETIVDTVLDDLVETS